MSWICFSQWILLVFLLLSLSCPLCFGVCVVLTVGWTLSESLPFSPVADRSPVEDEKSQPFLNKAEMDSHSLLEP